VEITRFEGYVGGAVCNPWLLICYPVAVPVESVLGSRHAWDWGIDVGAGLNFKTGHSSSFYIETRYHYIFGNSYDLPDGTTRKANGRYLPLTAGFRF